MAQYEQIPGQDPELSAEELRALEAVLKELGGEAIGPVEG